VLLGLVFYDSDLSTNVAYTHITSVLEPMKSVF